MQKAFLPLLICVLSVVSVRAQSVGYYPFNSVISVSTNPGKVAWIDLKIQANSFFSSLSTEISPTVNLNKNPKGRYYIGGGVRANFLASITNAKIMEGYFINLGVRSAPIEKIPQLQFIFELSPYVDSDFDSGLFRARLGTAYNFSQKKKK
jgi:hypothetical protein